MHSCLATTDATGKSDQILLLIIKDKLMCIANVNNLYLTDSFYKNDLKAEICEVYLFINPSFSKLYLHFLTLHC